MPTLTRSERWLGLLAGVVVLGGCGSDPATAPAGGGECVPVVLENGEQSGKCLPVAPKDQRVDTGVPAFSHPTEVTNPLHPTSRITQTIYGGQVDGKPFHTEVTLLPEVKTINWRGQRIEAVTVQYFALLDGRIHEVALDWYAQADDGAVWYLGEDVFNYADGVVADTDGTWIANDRTPAAMIMPAHPKVADVYRPENAPGVVFEEVAVKAVNETVPGPSGDITGAMTVEELHMDGTREAKTFAPGYGEYSTGNPDGDLEAASLALPTDALTGPIPSTVDSWAAATRQAEAAVGAGDWALAATAAGAVRTAWTAARPPGMSLLNKQIDRDIDALTTAVNARDADAARNATLRVAQDELDVRSRYQPVVRTDVARFALWVRQLGIDAAAADRAGVAGDATCLKWTFDRVRHEVSDPGAVDDGLAALDAAVERGDLAAAAAQATALASALR